MIREISNMRKDDEKENKMKLAQDIRIERRRMGLLPTLSEARPRIGEKMNCIIEKEATRKPMLEASA